MKRIISILFLVFALTGVVFANGEFDGYIVELKDNSANLFGASLFGVSEHKSDEEFVEILCETTTGISEIYARKNLIKVQNKETLDELVSLGLVEYYEPDLYAELYGYDISKNTQYKNQKNLDAINFEYAYNKGIFGEGVRVAVIDSGVYSHADLEANIEKGHNYVAQSLGVAADDTTDNYFHGTFVSGIIAGMNNNRDIVGISHKANIIPFKVCNDKNKGPLVSDIEAAIYNAVDNFDCDVINLSLGVAYVTTIVDGVMTPFDYSDGVKSLKKAVDHAIQNGCIVVAASGNNGLDETTSEDENTGSVTQKIYYSYPASFDNVVSVANADTTGSNFVIKSSSTFNDMVDIAAPGTNIISTGNSRAGLMQGSGTSFAAPHISAVAALAKSIDPDITQTEFMYYLKSTADSSYKSGQNADWYWGAGLVDIEAFINRVLRNKDLLVSQIDVQDYGNNTSVYLYNPSDETVEYTVLIENTNSKTSQKIVDVSIDAGQTKEVSLTKHGFSGSVMVTVFNKDDTNFESPICEREGYIPLSGDINGDGFVDIKDAIMLSRYLADFDTFTFDCKMAANVYNADDTKDIDENINIKDAILLSQYLAEMDVQLPRR